MTIIELFDGEQINNIALHLFFPESRIIYIGHRSVMTKRRKRALSRFFESRGCNWAPEYIEIKRFDVESIMTAAESVFNAEPECVLDITGGEELSLVAMGVLSGRYSIPLVKINLRSGTLMQMFGPPIEQRTFTPITVPQLALLHGGCIIRSDDSGLITTEQLRNDVLGLWRLAEDDRSFLNRAAAQLNLMAAYANGLDVDTLSAGLPVTVSTRSVMRKLYRGGYIDELYLSDDGVSFSYGSEQVKKLLTKAGMTLEVFTRIAAEDSGVFFDIRQGVALDWDGLIDPESPAGTSNEVDVIMQRGMTPVFISCKNGEVKKEALYELSVVAERFGGAYARKALICSHLTGTPAANDALRRRAQDMGVTLIEDVYAMDIAKLSKELAKFK